MKTKDQIAAIIIEAGCRKHGLHSSGGFLDGLKSSVLRKKSSSFLMK
ncbi:MAG: hypothetical protein U0X76_05170 [Bacteroidia bacterium]